MPLDNPEVPPDDPGGPDVDLEFTNNALGWSFNWRGKRSPELVASCFVVAAAKLSILAFQEGGRQVTEADMQHAERAFAVALRRCAQEDFDPEELE